MSGNFVLSMELSTSVTVWTCANAPQELHPALSDLCLCIYVLKKSAGETQLEKESKNCCT